MMTISNTVAEGIRRSSRHESTAHRSSEDRSLVDTVRQVVRELVLAGETGRRLALELIEDHWTSLDSSCPLSADLRPWQLLASDLAVALSRDDPDRSRRAREISEQIRSTVTMMARNPVEELALRPASRRVLVALHELGGKAEAAQVRERSGHSESHLSNSLRALRGHGLVALETGRDDRRRKILTLTKRGRAEIARHVAPKVTDTLFRSNLKVARSVLPEEAYPRERLVLERG